MPETWGHIFKAILINVGIVLIFIIFEGLVLCLIEQRTGMSLSDAFFAIMTGVIGAGAYDSLRRVQKKIFGYD